MYLYQISTIFYRFHGYCFIGTVLLQVWVGILVVVPLRVHYIISLLSKYILIVISNESIIIRSLNTGYRWSATKCKMCEKSANQV